MRIWCVSIVLTLTCNSIANSETLTPLPIKEKISSSRSQLQATQSFRFMRLDIGVERAHGEIKNAAFLAAVIVIGLANHVVRGALIGMSDVHLEP